MYNLYSGRPLCFCFNIYTLATALGNAICVNTTLTKLVTSQPLSVNHWIFDDENTYYRYKH